MFLNKRVLNFFNLLFLMMTLFIIKSSFASPPFSLPQNDSRYSMSIYGEIFTINNIDAQDGDQIAVFDPQGTICGLFSTTPDMIGLGFYVEIYGEDPDTVVDEGPLSNEILTFVVWDESEGAKITLTNAMFVQTGAYGAPAIETVPPKFIDQDFRGMGVRAVAAPPEVSITQISPVSALMTGGDALKVTGDNFESDLRIWFGNSESTSVTVNSNTSAMCIIPTHDAGVVSIIVTSNGKSDTLTNAFEYIALSPNIEDVQPDSGFVSGNTLVTISGNNFQTGLTVTIGEQEIYPENVTSTQISFTNTAHSAGVFNITVTNPDGQTALIEDSFTYVYHAPVITQVSPTSVSTKGIDVITITGQYFREGAKLFIAGIETPLTLGSSVSATCIVPAYTAAGNVDVIIENDDGKQALLEEAIEYFLPPPTITSLSPTNAFTTGGGTLHITGTNFQEDASIYFGDLLAQNIVFVSDTYMTCDIPVSPIGVGAVSIRLANPNGDSVTRVEALTYEYQPPAIFEVSPNKAYIEGADIITLTGEFFRDGARVYIAGNEVSSLTLNTSESITCEVPPYTAAEFVDILVVNDDDKQDLLEDALEYKRIIAKFEFLSPVSGKAPFNVVVKDESLGQELIQEWFWHFGDETEWRDISDIVEFEFTTPRVEPYPITLHVISNDGDDVSEAAYIRVTEYGVFLDFSTPSMTIGTPPLNVHFINESFTEPLSVTSWTWNFGDGTTSNAFSPTHTYNQVGTYSVSLTAEIETVDEPIQFTIYDFITVVERQIKGRILNADGQGISNCEVVIDIPGKNIIIPSVMTDENGYYTFANLPPEDFHLAVYPGLETSYFPTHIPDLISTINENTDNINLTLYTGMLTGKISRRTSGEGIPDIEIMLFNDTGEYAHFRSSPSGDYTLTGIPDGEYFLNAWFENTGTEIFYVEGGTTSLHSQAEMITITSEHSKTTPRLVDMILDDGTTISGRVVFGNETPASGIHVNAWSEGLMIGGNATTNEEGVYTITGLTPVPSEEPFINKYIVEIHPQNYPYQAYQMADNPEAATRVSAPNTEINFVIRSGLSIKGTVSVDLGSPQNIEVAARSDNALFENFSLTDANGNYTITGLPPADDYVVFAHSPDFPVIFYNDKSNELEANRVDLTYGDALGIDFSMSKGAMIKGNVSGGAFDPATDVIWVHVWSDSTGTGGDVPTDNDGNYEVVGLDPAAEDYIIFIIDPIFGQAYYKNTGETVYSYQDLNFDNNVAIGVDESSILLRNLVLQSNFYKIKGKVLYNNLPVPGIQIEAWSEENNYWQTCLSVTRIDQDNANYELSGLISGTYEISIISDKYILSNSRMVTITTADVLNVDLILSKPNRTISGTISNLTADSRAWVSAFSESADFGKEVMVTGTGATVNYAITALKPADDYVVHIHAMDYPDIIYNAKNNWFDANRVNVLKTDQSNINFSFSTDTATISGTITVPQGAEIGEEIWIDAFSESSRSNGAAMVRVSENCSEVNGCEAGTYIIKGLKKADDYVVIANSEKYKTIFYDGQPIFEDVTLVNISSNSQENIDFSMEVGYYISGTITDTNSSGIEGIEVEAWSDATSSFGWAQTDVNGEFKIEGLNHAADFVVQAFKTDEPPFIYKNGANNTRDISFATEVESVSEGSTNVIIVIETGFQLSGIVKDSYGKGLQGIIVSAHSQTGSLETFSQTNSSGYYTIKGLPGNYVYDVAADPGPTKSYVRQEKTVTIEDSNVQINFTLNSGYQVSGTIRNSSYESISEAGIFLRSDTTGYEEWVPSNQDGEYFFKGVPSGTDYQMMVETDANYAIYLESNISVTNNLTKNISLISASGKISGYVYKNDGKTGLSNVNIQIYSDTVDFQSFDVFTNTKGYYEVNGLESASDYLVKAIPPASSAYAKDSVTGKSPGDVVNFTLLIGGAIKGTVQTSAGTKLGDVFVTLTSQSLNVTDENTRTDANGNYAFSNLKSSSSSDYVVTVYPESKGYPATEKSGNNIGSTVDFNLTKGSLTTISGTVRIDGELPSTTVRVYIYNPDAIRVGSVDTDSSGNFEFTTLDSTIEYRLRFITRDRTLNYYASQDGSSVNTLAEAYAFSTGSTVNFVHSTAK